MSEKLSQLDTLLEELMELDKMFAREHNRMYDEHAKAAKAGDGLFCKIFEAAMGAHDRAWCKIVGIIPFELHQKVLKEIYPEK